MNSITALLILTFAFQTAPSGRQDPPLDPVALTHQEARNKTQNSIKDSIKDKDKKEPQPVTLNQKADGFHGIWYMNQPSNDQYVYKYSGGLGTYCAKHKPFAIYAADVDKTFFCYGGATVNDSRKLLHMVSCFDHKTGRVQRPTILLDKRTNDAHDNPVISLDADGYIWIFSTSHGRSRPSYIHKSVRPYDIDQFQLISATRMGDSQPIPLDNFSYFQVWHQPDQGFQAFFTRYGFPAARTICFMNSADGQNWSQWQRIAAIEEGHYQVSGIGNDRLGTMFNYHPKGKGLNWRTNLYYVHTDDFGKTWTNVKGEQLELPLTEADNNALVIDFAKDKRNVYLKDLRFDSDNHPVLLYITSGGYEAGPKNDPRTWQISRWNGQEWLTSPVTSSDNNYDMGELWLVADNDWRIMGPTETGPQPYNPGGEVAMWQSTDQGESWTQVKTMTGGSEKNHGYVRRVINGHDDFVALWADGHGRQPSDSTLYFANRSGEVFALPHNVEQDWVVPLRVDSGTESAIDNQGEQ